MTTIEVIGTGCAKCNRLFANAEQAVKDLKIADEVIKVSDIDALSPGASCLLHSLLENKLKGVV